jgi:TRAP-type C4-dicarboxylate transport system substrate-binding protein
MAYEINRSMASWKRLFFTACIAALLSLPLAQAMAITIKVASLVPEGSPWHRALIKIAAEWHKISNGSISLKIYPGGVAGDETDAIRKMRINQIQAAMVTGKGLAYIHPDFYVYQLPFVAHNDEELDYLFFHLRPELEQLLEQKGFTLLGFSKSGWLHFFAKTEATTPEQMRRLKIFSLEGHARIDQAMKEMGFQIVPLKANDVYTAMQSGMVEAFAAAPLVAASMQWFALAPHMNDFNWSPMTGGLIITNRAWRTIPPDLQPRLLQATEEIMEALYLETMEVENKAFEIMKDNGLIIHLVPEDVVEEWQALVHQGFEMIVGDTISREIYEQAAAILEYFRSH